MLPLPSWLRGLSPPGMKQADSLTVPWLFSKTFSSWPPAALPSLTQSLDRSPSPPHPRQRGSVAGLPLEVCCHGNWEFTLPAWQTLARAPCSLGIESLVFVGRDGARSSPARNRLAGGSFPRGLSEPTFPMSLLVDSLWWHPGPCAGNSPISRKKNSCGDVSGNHDEHFPSRELGDRLTL